MKTTDAFMFSVNCENFQAKLFSFKCGEHFDGVPTIAPNKSMVRGRFINSVTLRMFSIPNLIMLYQTDDNFNENNHFKACVLP